MRVGIALLIFFLCGPISLFASSAIEKQLREQRKALENLEHQLQEQRQQLKAMENEEKGVLNNLSLLDQNLGQTKEYVQRLSQTVQTMNASVVAIRLELDSLNGEVERQRNAMKTRIRSLYIHGRQSQMEQLWKLLRQKENPERTIYQVRRLLEDDQDRVVRLRTTLDARRDRQQQLQDRLTEISTLRSRKQKEELGLVTQISHQENALDGLRRDKETQQKALDEFEQNQKMMISLIQALEDQRKKEEAARAAERKRKGVKAPKVSTTLAAVGPKCVPHKGEVISGFGLQEHAILHTMTRNLGIEIRTERGDPIKAAAAGKVVAVMRISGRGPSVILQHGEMLYTVYGHLSQINVQVGQEVRMGQVIGEAGDEESLNGPKLYFQVSEGVHAIDPIQWLRSTP